VSQQQIVVSLFNFKVLILIVLEVSLWVSQMDDKLLEGLDVLILIVLEVSLWDRRKPAYGRIAAYVLILIVLEVSLWVQ